MRTQVLLFAAVVFAASLGVAQVVDTGSQTGVAAKAAPAALAASAAVQSPPPSADEERSRTLLQLKAQRAVLAGKAADDPDLPALDEQIKELQQQIVLMREPVFTDTGGTPAAQQAAYPRIVQQSYDEPGYSTLTTSSASYASNSAATVAVSPSASDTPANQGARRSLEQSVALVTDSTRLAEAVESIAAQTHANIYVNWAALQAAGVDKNTPVTLRLSSVSASRALRATLDQAGGSTNSLGFTFDDGVVTVSTRDDLESSRYQEVRIYNIRDLLAVGGQYPPEVAGALAEERFQKLCDIIKNFVRPESWRDNGGTVGSLNGFDGLLVVNQTPDNHAALQLLLAKIRAAR